MAIELAWSIFDLALVSVPSATTSGRFSAINCAARKAWASDKWLATGEATASRAWVNASIPVAAVSPGGKPIERFASNTAISGSRYGPARWHLILSAWLKNTATGETSAPVPAVVGTPICGICIGCAFGQESNTNPDCSASPISVSLWCSAYFTPLEASSTLPPPTAKIASAATSRAYRNASLTELQVASGAISQ